MKKDTIKNSLVTGLTIVVTVLTFMLIKERKETERLPDWAYKWREKCCADDLIFENGLPFFAEDGTTAYSDAFSNDQIRDLKRDGYKIIDRPIK